jgi:hypothetical protein
MADPDELLRSHLLTLAVLANARVSALFLRTQDDQRLRLAASNTIDSTALETAETAWERRRDELKAGALLRIDAALLWPLLDDGRLAAVVYLEPARSPFPTPADRAAAQPLLARLRRGSATAVELAPEPAACPKGTLQDQLARLLSERGADVAAIARHLGLSRQTVLERMARLGLRAAGRVTGG